MLTLLRWLARLPLGPLHLLGSALGWATWLASPTYRRRFAGNARQAGFAFRETRGAVGAAGRMVTELPRLWFRPAGARLEPPPRWHGEAHVEAAHAAGRGVLFLTPHLGSFEVTAQAYAERYGAEHPVTVLFRPARKALIRDVMAGARERPGLSTAPATLAGVRQMMRALRRGEAVGLLPDQVPPNGMGVWAPFFGRPAYTMTLAARLAQQTGAVRLLIWGERLPRGRGYAIRVSPMHDALPAGAADAAASAAIVNRAMERLIREAPGQYLWGYNRYKQPREALATTAPAGDAAGPAPG